MNLQKHLAAVSKLTKIDEKKNALTTITFNYKKEISGDRREYIMGVRLSKETISEIFKVMESKLLAEIKQLEHEFKMI